MNNVSYDSIMDPNIKESLVEGCDTARPATEAEEVYYNPNGKPKAVS